MKAQIGTLEYWQEVAEAVTAELRETKAELARVRNETNRALAEAHQRYAEQAKMLIEAQASTERARDELTEILLITAPECEPLPDCLGLVSQISNWIAGEAERTERVARRAAEIGHHNGRDKISLIRVTASEIAQQAMREVNDGNA